MAEARRKGMRTNFAGSLRHFVLWIAAAFWIFFPGTVFACPMCTELIERGRDALSNMRFGEGVAWSMLLMFGMPALLVGGGALVVIRASRRAKRGSFHESERRA